MGLEAAWENGKEITWICQREESSVSRIKKRKAFRHSAFCSSQTFMQDLNCQLAFKEIFL